MVIAKDQWTVSSWSGCAFCATLRNKGGVYNEKGSTVWKGLEKRSKWDMYYITESEDMKFFSMWSWARGQAMVNEAKEEAGRDLTMQKLEATFEMT